MKKDKGTVMSIFPPLFAIIAVAVMLVFYMGWMGNIARNDEVRQVGREYILAMEDTEILPITEETVVIHH